MPNFAILCTNLGGDLFPRACYGVSLIFRPQSLLVEIFGLLVLRISLGSMSNFGALATGFTPPPGCSTTNVYLYATEGQQTYIQAPVDIKQCFPDGYNPEVQAGYFSPAQCPVGYTAACISLNTIGNIGETVITCCPRL